jgi:hypothetical protein
MSSQLLRRKRPHFKAKNLVHCLFKVSKTKEMMKKVPVKYQYRMFQMENYLQKRMMKQKMLSKPLYLGNWKPKKKRYKLNTRKMQVL